MPALPITSGFYVSPSLPLSAQECLNWYVNVSEAPALSPENLFGTPGLVELVSSGTIEEQNRGMHEMAGIAYAVNGSVLYKIVETITGGVATYSLTSLGTITGTAQCSIADNGTQLMVLVPGGDGYIYNHVTDTFAQITDTDFDANGNPQFVVFIDSYFVCTTDTKKFICSAPNDGLSYNALDFGTAESDPDVTVAPIVFKNQLFISGSQTIEAFQNVGGTDFPFQRTGLFLQKGVYAPYSLINAQDTVVWVGGGENEGPSIWALSGNDTAKISSTPIDNLLQALTLDQLQSIYAWAYSQNGAYFIGFTLPTTTLVFDLTAKRWHERRSVLDGDLSRYRVRAICKAYNQILCGDFVDGRIGRIDPLVYTEYENTIIRRVATQPFQNNLKSIFVPSLELTVESGVGNDDVVNPVISLERSADGKTWSDARTRSIGEVGEYDRRAIWRRNGRVSRFEIFRFTLTDAVKPVILQLNAEIIGGTK
jgi:hypothetical protein